MIAFIAFNLTIALCVFAASRMSIRRARPARLWMWSAAFLGPLPLALLACLPQRRRR